MKNLILIILLFPILTYGQFDNETYGYIHSGVDVKNTILRNGVNETKGYNGTIEFGYKAQAFQVEGFVEFYPNIDYTGIGMNVYYVFNNEANLRPLIGLQLSTIDRGSAHIVNGEKINGKLNASFGANLALEYHLGRFFARATWNIKYRSDLQTFEQQKKQEKPFTNYLRGNGYVGIGYKF